MKTIQLHLPDDLADKMQRITTNAEKFILDLLRSKVGEFEKPSLADEYKTAALENKSVAEDFKHTDLEGWNDDY